MVLASLYAQTLREASDVVEQRRTKRSTRPALLATLLLLGCGDNKTVYTDSTGATFLAECDEDDCSTVYGSMECGGDPVLLSNVYIAVCAGVDGRVQGNTCRPIRCGTSDECSRLFNDYECLDGYCRQSEYQPYRSTFYWDCLASEPRGHGDCQTAPAAIQEADARIEAACPYDGTAFQRCASPPLGCALPE